MKERQVLDEKYVVIRPLGSGPTGTLYDGQNLLLGSRVAIKMVDPALARRPGVAERVLQRAREAAGLDHPNIASVLDLGEWDGTPYIVMEPLGGHSLQREIDAQSRPGVMAACDLVLQVLSALDYAHAIGVIHGALHPNNVLISYPRPGVPWVKVTDFGLYQALEDVHGDGPHPAPGGSFRAPEYASGGDVDQRADVYSAAALLHALLHGVPPGAAAEPSSRVPLELTRLIAAATRPHPRDRIGSVEELASRLAPFAHEAPRSEPRISSPPSIRWISAPASSSTMAALSGTVERRELAPATEQHPPEREPGVTDSLLRNPRFPSDRRSSPWSRRWRSLRTRLASRPHTGAAWAFAAASVGAGIACALLAAWMQ